MLACDHWKEQTPRLFRMIRVRFRDDVTEEEYRAANRAAKMKGRCDDEPRKPRVRKVKDKNPL